MSFRPMRTSTLLSNGSSPAASFWAPAVAPAFWGDSLCSATGMAPTLSTLRAAARLLGVPLPAASPPPPPPPPPAAAASSSSFQSPLIFRFSLEKLRLAERCSSRPLLLRFRALSVRGSARTSPVTR